MNYCASGGLNLFWFSTWPAHNSDLPLRFGTRPRSASGKFPFCHSFAAANYVPVPNVPTGLRVRELR